MLSSSCGATGNRALTGNDAGIRSPEAAVTRFVPAAPEMARMTACAQPWKAFRLAGLAKRDSPGTNMAHFAMLEIFVSLAPSVHLRTEEPTRRLKTRQKSS